MKRPAANLLRTTTLLLLMAGAVALGAWAKDGRRQQKERLFRQLYLESVCQRESGHPTAQYELLRRALELNPHSIEAQFDMGMLCVSGGLGQEECGCEYIERAIAGLSGLPGRKSQREAYMEAYAAYLLYANDLDRSELIWNELAKNPVKREVAYSSLIQINERQHDYQGVLDAVDGWAAIQGMDDNLADLKLRALRRLERYEESLALADSLASLRQGDYYWQVAKAETYFTMNDTARGARQAERLMQEAPDDPTVQILALNYSEVMQKPGEARLWLRRLLLNGEQQERVRLSLVKSLVGNAGQVYTAGYVDSLLIELMDTRMETPALARAYAEYLDARKADIAAYVPAMRKIVEIDPTDKQAHLMLVQEALKRKDYGAAAEHCRETLRFHPGDLQVYGVMASCLNIQKRYPEAEEVMTAGLPYARRSRDREKLSDFYTTMADVLENSGQSERAFQYYDSALTYNPNNVVLMNNYAYALSQKGERLPDARKWAERVLDIEPSNGTYIDTYAWILFQLGDYKGARLQIDEAIDAGSEGDDNGTLLDHAGDIYFLLGLKDEAVRFWTEALQKNPESDLLRQKVKQKRYIAPDPAAEPQP